MKYIVATEDKIRYWWEILTQINNFKRIGLDSDLIYLVGTSTDKLSTALSHIKFHTGVEIHGYKDGRNKNVLYNPTIRPYVIKKFLYEKYKNEKSEPFMYLDTDVLLLKNPKNVINWKNDVWYLSDTKSYINSKYIKNKSVELFKEMCDIVDVDFKLIEDNDNNAGGAQYVIKNTDWKFWDKVEKDSEDLYRHMVTTSNKYNPQHPIQAWTADMWSVLWNGIRSGHKMSVVKPMDFLWATDSIKKCNLQTYYLYHNAGVTNQSKLFYKGKYVNRSPFYDDLSWVDKDYCSSFYVDEIINTKKNYPELTKFI
jgi:hypothetical protein